MYMYMYMLCVCVCVCVCVLRSAIHWLTWALAARPVASPTTAPAAPVRGHASQWRFSVNKEPASRCVNSRCVCALLSAAALGLRILYADAWYLPGAPGMVRGVRSVKGHVGDVR